jgi:CspA family cold shock protein
MSNKVKGTVKWFNKSKGFGCIERQDGPDAFAHFPAIKTKEARTLQQGQQVTFTLERGLRGFSAKRISVDV